jgi:hypothetical protein
MNSNDVAVVVPPAFYQEDLLTTFKAEFGFTVNFPDIVIWRIRLKLTLHLKYPAAITNEETYGALVGFFVDDAAFGLKSVGTFPYAEKYMWYETIYNMEAVMSGAPVPVANGFGSLVHNFDIKTRRKLGNIEDTLIMQVAPVGGLASINGISWNASVLLKLP